MRKHNIKVSLRKCLDLHINGIKLRWMDEKIVNEIVTHFVLKIWNDLWKQMPTIYWNVRETYWLNLEVFGAFWMKIPKYGKFHPPSSAVQPGVMYVLDPAPIHGNCWYLWFWFFALEVLSRFKVKQPITDQMGSLSSCHFSKKFNFFFQRKSSDRNGRSVWNYIFPLNFEFVMNIRKNFSPWKGRQLGGSSVHLERKSSGGGSLENLTWHYLCHVSATSECEIFWDYFTKK